MSACVTVLAQLLKLIDAGIDAMKTSHLLLLVLGMVALVVLAVFNPKRPHRPRPGPAPAPKRTFTIESNRFIKDGEPLRLISGRCAPHLVSARVNGPAFYEWPCSSSLSGFVIVPSCSPSVHRSLHRAWLGFQGICNRSCGAQCIVLRPC